MTTSHKQSSGLRTKIDRIPSLRFLRRTKLVFLHALRHQFRRFDMRAFAVLSLTALGLDSASAAKYVICDNDWSGSASFIPPLIYINAGYEVGDLLAILNTGPWDYHKHRRHLYEATSFACFALLGDRKFDLDSCCGRRYITPPQYI
jgi:hypothetical protein